MVDRVRPTGLTQPLPRARQNPGNFPVQFRGSKITDAEITAVSIRHEGIGYDGDFGTSASFTNTSYFDLDALTGGTALRAVAVTVKTGERALVFWSGRISNNGGNSTRVSYRVSGSTTQAASDNHNLLLTGQTASPLAVVDAAKWRLQTGLTPGSNTFELQARVSAGTGTLRDAELVVVPI